MEIGNLLFLHKKKDTYLGQKTGGRNDEQISEKWYYKGIGVHSGRNYAAEYYFFCPDADSGRLTASKNNLRNGIIHYAAKYLLYRKI